MVGCHLTTHCLNSNTWWKRRTCFRPSNISKSHHTHWVNPSSYLCSQHHQHHHHHHHCHSIDRKAHKTIVSIGCFLLQQSSSMELTALALSHPEVVSSQHPLLGSACSSEPLSRRNWLGLSQNSQGGHLRQLNKHQLQRHSSRVGGGAPIRLLPWIPKWQFSKS